MSVKAQIVYRARGRLRKASPVLGEAPTVRDNPVLKKAKSMVSWHGQKFKG